MPLSVGLIGFGAIGASVLKLLLEAGESVCGALVRPGTPKTSRLTTVASLDAFLDLHPDIVIECAGQAAFRAFAPAILESGKTLVAASVGILADDELRTGILAAGEKGGSALRIPSGAMVGIDGLNAARLIGVNEVVYRGTMHPSALKSFEGDKEASARMMIYEGKARDAVFKFPKNANLTATIALAGIGFDRTKVQFHVDPAIQSNIHELEVSGAFGSFRTHVLGHRISDVSPSSRIVAGSLVQAARGSGFTLLDRLSI